MQCMSCVIEADVEGKVVSLHLSEARQATWYSCVLVGVKLDPVTCAWELRSLQGINGAHGLSRSSERLFLVLHSGQSSRWLLVLL